MCGALVEPCLALPVPFCLKGFLPPPLTSALVFVEQFQKFRYLLPQFLLVNRLIYIYLKLACYPPLFPINIFLPIF